MKRIAGAGGVGVASGLAGCAGGQDTTTTEGGGTTDTGEENTDDSDSNTEGGSGDRIRKLEFELLGQSTFPKRFQVGRITAETWKNLGLAIDAYGVETQTLIDRMVNDEYKDMMAMWFGPDANRLDPQAYLSWWTTDNGSNWWNWSSEEYDKLVAKQKETYNTEERQKVVREAQALWNEHQPGTGLQYGDRNNMYNSNRFKNPKPIVGEALDTIWSRAYIEPKEGVSTLRVGNPEKLSGQNPLALFASVNKKWLQLMYDPLFRIDQDGNPIPWAASEYEFADDTTIELKLREGMKWHDGEDVTAEDVKFTYETTAEISGYYQSHAQQFESVETNGDLEVTLNLKNKNAPILTTTLSQILLVPKHKWKDIDNKIEHTNENPIGSGPYKFNYHRQEVEASIVANEDHFRPPNPDEELFVMHDNMQGIYQSLEEKEIDMAVGPSPGPTTIERMKKLDYISIVQQKAHGAGWVIYDVNEKPFDDRAFRKALTMARPTKKWSEVVFAGRTSITDGPIPSVLDRWYNSDVDWRGDNVEAARQILKDAGYSWDSDGRLHYPE
jgi:peptide/nickel transport system substrate-binding protein